MERPWADGLPLAAAEEIVRRLPCIAHRGAMAAVCRAWRALAETRRPSPLLPWLLVPTASSARVCCFLNDGAVNHYINNLPRGARYFGSHEGTWLFVAFDQCSDHEVINLRARGTHFLPDAVLRDGEYLCPMSILAAALTSPPPSGIVGGIGAYHHPDGDAQRRRRFAFCAIGGDVVAYEFPTPPDTGDADIEVEDVLYHDRSRVFYFLTRGEHILACTATVNAHDQEQPPLVATVLRRFRSGRCEYEEPVRARYLVQSGKELLMVVRFAPHAQAHTSSFRVFCAIPPSEVEVAPSEMHEVEDCWHWVELETLGARVLFVGRGCSRFYPVAKYPELNHGIYFSDDRGFHDDDVMVRERQYPCSDIGKWSEGTPASIRFFFPEHAPCRWSASTWILPRRLPPELPIQLLVHILSKLSCDTDRFRAVRTCRLKPEQLAVFPQLPWLVMPSLSGSSMACLTCSAPSAIHACGVPVNARGARMFGSFDGRWIFIAPDDRHQAVMNTFSGKMYSLPNLVRFGFGGKGVFRQKILAATLSMSPDDRRCIAAGIFRYKHPTSKSISTAKFGCEGKGRPSTQISVWRMGAEKAVDPLSSADKMVYPDADDILFYNDELHCINRGEDLFVWSPTNLPNGDLKLDNLDDWRHFFVDYELDHALSRYFVESQGQLLLVVKYGTDTDRSRPVTRRFRVSRLTVPKFDVTQRGPVMCPCVEEPDLDGRMLFVGRGCSRSFEVVQYPGSSQGIYFLDDRSFCAIDHTTFHDPNVIHDDNGRWMEGASAVERCYQQAPSNMRSPPAWLLP